MTTLAQVRDGLFNRLDTIDGLRVHKQVPEDSFYPAAIIYPPVNTDYRDDLGMGGFTSQWIVMLMVPAIVDRRKLDLYALVDRTGPSSVFAAIEADRTVGGRSVDALVVSAADPMDLTEMAGTKVYQRAVLIQVIIT